jgi:hypothetical protein
MLNINSLKIHPFSYPILKTNCLIENNTYNELKNNWPDFNKFQTNSAGQVSRNNIEIIRGNDNYNQINYLFRELYNYLDSKYFKDFLKKKFDFDDAIKNKGFIGDFDNSQLIMHIAESINGYENPWHVDTRGRIIHFLIYFGDETIEEGGEFGIAIHKKQESFLNYKQYPDIYNLENIEYFKPKNNLGIFILSQNNSYHKGCRTKGLRKFIYAAYTNKSGDAWETKDWLANKSFYTRLNEELKI